MNATEMRCLQVIHDRPEDDDARRVYADWLSERGDDRGELITIQCMRATLDENDPRRGDIAGREGELIWRHEREWLGPLQPRRTHFAFARGFLAHPLVVTSQQLAENRDLLLRLVPTLYEVVREVSAPGRQRVLLEARIHGAEHVTGRCALRRYALPERQGECMHLGAAADPEVAFYIEQRIAGWTHHPNLVRGVGLAYGWNGDTSLAFEWLDGADLRTLRTEYRDLPLDPGLAAWIVSQVCLGLEHMHTATDTQGLALGLIHQRVRPQHVMLTVDGQVKLIDFSDATSSTEAGPHPEFGDLVLASGRDRVCCHDDDDYASMLPAEREVGRQADILAAALLLCDLVSGHTQFRSRRGAGFQAAVREALRRAPTLQWIALDAPRHATARELHRALEDAIHQKGWPAGPAVVSRYVNAVIRSEPHP